MKTARGKFLARRDFPFIAQLTTQDQRMSDAAGQPVKVLEAFGVKYRIQAMADTYFPGIAKPVPSGSITCVEKRLIHELIN